MIQTSELIYSENFLVKTRGISSTAMRTLVCTSIKEKILITGGSGKLGRELKRVFPHALTPTHKVLDITSLDNLKEFVSKNEITLIIHAAAMTDVRKCEVYPNAAERVNTKGTINVIIAANSVNAKVIYISTACVFNGETAPFSEHDTPDPKNKYALTKFQAEQYVAMHKNNLIIRTNFVAFEKWPYSAAFTDRYGTYLFAHDVADAIYDLKDKSGLVHVCGRDTLSMYNLAKLTTPDVKPMTMKDYQGPHLTRDMRLISVMIYPFVITPKILTPEEL